MSHARVMDMVHQELEDKGDEDLLDFVSEDEADFDEIEAPLKFDQSFPASLFISGLPKVGKEKFDKLMNVLRKMVDKYGTNTNSMPMNEQTNQTEGFCIVSYEKASDADTAKSALDGIQLDKSHRFKVIKLDKFDEIMQREEEFRPQRNLTTVDREDFRDWLQDKKFREQFLLRYQQETEIYWNDTMQGGPVLCYGGEREKRNKKIWCDWRVQWSPAGSYLATFHQPGIALWAGPQFETKLKFMHHGVKFIDFSPNEDFLLTWNGSHPSEEDNAAVRIFRVLTGECVKKCRTPTVVPIQASNPSAEFPHFLWSFDSQYYAECNSDSIMVRSVEDFELIKDEDGKKKMLKYGAGLSTFQWSPKDNILAVWILEKDNNPARLVLVEVPSRKELASRSRTQVEASMHWQSEGDYLCLHVTKLSKTKKKVGTNLEIFRIRDRNIPVDIVEVKDTVRGFYWETKGSRFSVLTTDEGGLCPKLLIYQLGKDKCENISVTNLPSNSFNNCFWAPEGQYFVCAAIGHGDLLFAGLTADNKLEINHKEEHFMLTNVEWDPSARYVITSVTQPHQNEMGGFKYSMEAGFAIWTFQGRLLHRMQKEKLFQVSWRPHPPSLLSAAQQNDIRKNIKQFSKRYDALDEQAKESARKAFRAERDEKNQGFQAILNRLQEYKEDREADTAWQEAWEALREEQNWEAHVTEIEQELGTSEELISG